MEQSLRFRSEKVKGWEKSEAVKEVEQFAESKGVRVLILDRKALIVTYKDGYNEKEGRENAGFFPDIGKLPTTDGLKGKKISSLDIDELPDGTIFGFCISHGDCYTAQVVDGEKNRWLRIWRDPIGDLRRGQALAVNLERWKMNTRDTNTIAEGKGNFVVLPYFLEGEGPGGLIGNQKEAEFSGTNWITDEVSNLTIYSQE